MKFRNPKTGEVFEEIWPLLNLYCISHNCENCSLPLNCARYCIDFPKEAARLMGYEVVEDDHIPQVEKKEANMDKPLKDWTLREVEAHCKQKARCKDCDMLRQNEYECRFSGGPCLWDLSEKPRFTEQEVEVAKAIKLLFPDVVKVCRLSGVIKAECENGSGECMIGAELLPSIQNHQSYTLDEIIGGAE